jgi:hypothetical protein
VLLKFLLTTSLIFGVIAGVSEAKPNKPDKKNPAQPTTVIITPVPANQTVMVFSPVQKNQLIGVIRGTGSEAYLLTEEQRLEIVRQYAALPPGIRKNLARGKGLPPGIAKKFILPTTVNTYLGIPTNRNIIVLGRNIVLLDPVSDRVLDILFDVL